MSEDDSRIGEHVHEAMRWLYRAWHRDEILVAEVSGRMQPRYVKHEAPTTYLHLFNVDDRWYLQRHVGLDGTLQTLLALSEGFETRPIDEIPRARYFETRPVMNTITAEHYADRPHFDGPYANRGEA